MDILIYHPKKLPSISTLWPAGPYHLHFWQEVGTRIRRWLSVNKKKGKCNTYQKVLKFEKNLEVKVKVLQQQQQTLFEHNVNQIFS